MDSVIIKGGQRGVERGGDKFKKCVWREREREVGGRERKVLVVIMKDDSHTG